MHLMNSIVVLVTLNALVSPGAIAMEPIIAFTDLDSAPVAAASSISSSHTFTMTLPAKGDRPFAMLSFSQQNQDQSVDPIQFDLSQTKAFVEGGNGAAIAIKQAWMDETGTVWLEFDPALAPKTDLRIEFQVKNLTPGKVYEYGIAAYPDTERPVAVYVGNRVLTK